MGSLRVRHDLVSKTTTTMVLTSSIFLFFKKPPYCFALHSPPTVPKGSLFSTLSPTLLFVVFLMIVILTGVTWLKFVANFKSYCG